MNYRHEIVSDTDPILLLLYNDCIRKIKVKVKKLPEGQDQ